MSNKKPKIWRKKVRPKTTYYGFCLEIEGEKFEKTNDNLKADTWRTVKNYNMKSDEKITARKSTGLCGQWKKWTPLHLGILQILTRPKIMFVG